MEDYLYSFDDELEYAETAAEFEVFTRQLAD